LVGPLSPNAIRIANLEEKKAEQDLKEATARRAMTGGQWSAPRRYDAKDTTDKAREVKTLEVKDTGLTLKIGQVVEVLVEEDYWDKKDRRKTRRRFYPALIEHLYSFMSYVGFEEATVDWCKKRPNGIAYPLGKPEKVWAAQINRILADKPPRGEPVSW
jgi:hypothetical protein